MCFAESDMYSKNGIFIVSGVYHIIPHSLCKFRLNCERVNVKMQSILMLVIILPVIMA